MGMYVGIFKGSILDAIKSNPDVYDVYADTQGFIAIQSQQTRIHSTTFRKDDGVPAHHRVGGHGLSLLVRLDAFLGRRAMTPGIMREKTSLWNLARISNRKKPIGANATMYSYNATAGQGVDTYIIDTGIFAGDSDFGGRVTWGTSVGSYKGKVRLQPRSRSGERLS